MFKTILKLLFTYVVLVAGGFCLWIYIMIWAANNLNIP